MTETSRGKWVPAVEGKIKARFENHPNQTMGDADADDDVIETGNRNREQQ